MARTGADTGIVWTFATPRFTVALNITPDYGYRYDGDDEDGETQEKLDSGEYVAFYSAVTVELDGTEIAADYLGGSVYSWDDIADFWTGHRSADPANRNSSANPIQGVSIGHYFPDMVRTAIAEARAHIRSAKPAPYIRPTAN